MSRRHRGAMRRRQAGLSLLEVLVALALMGLIAALAAGPLTRRLRMGELDREAAALARTLRDARLQAIAEGATRTVLLDLAGNRYALGGDWHVLPPALRLTLPGSGDPPPRLELTLRADGSASGVTLELHAPSARPSAARRLQLDWLTGSVKVSRP